MKEWLNKSKMTLREKSRCFNNPEEYDFVYFDLKNDNSTDYWMIIKPRFQDFKNVWFVRKSFMQNEKGTPVKSNPKDSAEWNFGMIVKADVSVKDISPNCFKSLACAKMNGGPFVAFFIPKTVRMVSDYID